MQMHSLHITGIRFRGMNDQWLSLISPCHVYSDQQKNDKHIERTPSNKRPWYART